MELALTPKQKKYLDKRGPMKAATLQTVYKKSVQDQQKTLNQAAKLLAARKKSK
jgi:hypothetical protein